MGDRGRKSAPDLAVILGTICSKRPDPPEELNKEQAKEWKELVLALPQDWFGRETHGLLGQYCRHVITARHVGKLIASLKKDGQEGFSIKEYDKLLQMRERESRAIMALSRSMRLSQQSTYSAMKGKGKSRGKPAWEY